MKSNELTKGTKVNLLRYHKGDMRHNKPAGYRSIGLFSVEEVNNILVRLKKDNVGYVETVSIIDLRQKNYVLQMEDGTYVMFPPMVDIKKLERDKQEKIDQKKAEDKRKEKKVMAMMTKQDVKKMFESGMTTDQIAEEYTKYYPKMNKSMLKAKVTMLLSGKKAGRPAKEKAPVTVGEQLPESNLYPVKTDIKEIAEQVHKEITEAAAESAEKIKLRQAVDEMMEMVPDDVDHPVHYTTGKFEVIDVLQDKLTAEEFEGFLKGVALQYIIRSRLKGGVQDIKKANWYLNRLIKFLESA